LTAPAAQGRLPSIDALRGLSVAAMLLVNDPGDWGHVYAPLLHSEWHGCTPTDLIFPLFLFIVGVSISLSIGTRAAAGAAPTALRRVVFKRTVRIVLLGLVLNVLAQLAFHAPHFRVMGVLQRIGLCYLVAGLVSIHTRARVQWLVIAGLLLGYWALLALGGGFDPGTNLASRVDTWVFGPLNYEFDPATGRGHDPEGLLSTLTAIATTLLGVQAGRWLRAGTSAKLWIAAALGLAIGFVWSLVFPLNKNLWTSSFVLWSAGWAFVVLALAHSLIDVRGWPALGRSLGRNAIAAYAGADLLVYVLIGVGLTEPIYTYAFASWLTPRFGPFVASLAYAVVFTAFWWVLMWLLDRRGVHIRI
jgi:predicted acyltransferase